MTGKVVLVLCLFAVAWYGSWTREHWTNRLVRWVAYRLGWTPLYWTEDKDEFKDLVWTHRYDDIDGVMMRPIHPQMSVAPPWAKLHWVRNEHVKWMLGHKKAKAEMLNKYRKTAPAADEVNK